MKFTAIPAAHLVVAQCKAQGIRQIVISPGSRNAPLILGFTSDPYFDCFSVVDERSAGFFAMGLAQQSGLPAALVCTSGSALLNYYPAVAEAYYSRIPLLVLSADRPPYKIDIGDGQTIRQEGVFEKHIGFQAQIHQDATHVTQKLRWIMDPEDTSRIIPAQDLPKGEGLKELQKAIETANYSLINQALGVAKNQLLPVHLNIPFEEPLYDLTSVPPVSNESSVKASSTGEFDIAGNETVVEWDVLQARWNASPRIMILAGAMPPDSLSDEIQGQLAADQAVLVLTETLSNLNAPEFFPSIDSIIAPIELKDSGSGDRELLQPDLLITMGGMIVSKKIKQYLRRFRPSAHWHVDPFHANDTFYTQPKHIKLSPQAFFEELFHRNNTELPKAAAKVDAVPAYRTYWDGVKDHYRKLRSAYLQTIPFSDFKAFALLSEALPEQATIQLANSSTVRYAQLFDRKPGHRVFGNRGTSGIEGSTSTAVGAAINAPTPTVCISGDLSFFYDINGLWNKYLPPDFKMVVLNNGGGGIFRILPGFKEGEQFEQYFETTHGTDVAAVCALHGLKYHLASDEQGLVSALKTFFNSSQTPQLLEIRTPRVENNKILLAYFDFLS
ncbi:2-succinyl-5-enolpyruvyl-6-hydroxy-3-cyclohexene-1-carboxylate synthase [Robiginitalea myxolifaciens]|uniref:2-succinyl-5-enolpyruvyl-6-hydroxy-3-cyclohexene-1-carboxylate synthase n=1 Tax=Robiginitalea myxolifaciens TaxID=400055 RepID=A0A1I6GTK6_9FLAO|nr:2-succinyl-5-enolpyruvyl-6-hydroxy-3-cyclohexene-1-carboxylate synthase [Robiginitalea myxolifaciens]SFR45603.1 2-succinyl-5-enolpyruvyl-6-hydroxy-3-cyclohexene-1-carboxylate synthase [Robiginitalea myxolifaciens]